MASMARQSRKEWWNDRAFEQAGSKKRRAVEGREKERRELAEQAAAALLRVGEPEECTTADAASFIPNIWAVGTLDALDFQRAFDNVLVRCALCEQATADREP